MAASQPCSFIFGSNHDDTALHPGLPAGGSLLHLWPPRKRWARGSDLANNMLWPVPGRPVLPAPMLQVHAGTVPLHKFVITKQLTKRPEDYPDAKNQPHVQVALRRRQAGKRDGMMAVRHPAAFSRLAACCATAAYQAISTWAGGLVSHLTHAFLGWLLFLPWHTLQPCPLSFGPSHPLLR